MAEHIQDFPGNRRKTIKLYQNVTDRKLDGTLIQREYGLRHKPSEYAAERIKEPFKRIENKENND